MPAEVINEICLRCGHLGVGRAGWPHPYYMLQCPNCAWIFRSLNAPMPQKATATVAPWAQGIRDMSQEELAKFWE